MSADWLIYPPSDPASQLAATMARRVKVHPIGSAIDELVLKYAAIEELEWQYKCDALVVGLGQSRPTIFLKAGQWAPRRRFSLAHELGHVLMPWHIGLAACTVDSDAEGSVGPADPSAILAPRRVNNQESEAQRFAGSILLPYAHVQRQLTSKTLQATFDTLPDSGMSAIAAALTLHRYFLPGFVFRVERSLSDVSVVSSSGTQLRNEDATPQRLAKRAYEYGSVQVAGKQLDWYRLVDDSLDTSLPADPRTTSEVLNDALALAGYTGEDAKRLFRSINGQAAGALSRDRTDTLKGLLAILMHKFDDPSFDAKVRDVADFDLYIRRKANERHKRIHEGR